MFQFGAWVTGARLGPAAAPIGGTLIKSRYGGIWGLFTVWLRVCPFWLYERGSKVVLRFGARDLAQVGTVGRVGLTEGAHHPARNTTVTLRLPGTRRAHRERTTCQVMTSSPRAHRLPGSRRAHRGRTAYQVTTSSPRAHHLPGARRAHRGALRLPGARRAHRGRSPPCQEHDGHAPPARNTTSSPRAHHLPGHDELTEGAPPARVAAGSPRARPANSPAR
jgi:hypothetical protein